MLHLEHVDDALPPVPPFPSPTPPTSADKLKMTYGCRAIMLPLYLAAALCFDSRHPRSSLLPAQEDCSGSGALYRPQHDGSGASYLQPAAASHPRYLLYWAHAEFLGYVIIVVADRVTRGYDVAAAGQRAGCRAGPRRSTAQGCRGPAPRASRLIHLNLALAGLAGPSRA